MFKKTEMLSKNFTYKNTLTILCTIKFCKIDVLDLNTRLILACKQGDEDATVDLINKHISVDIKSPLFVYPHHSIMAGATPLIVAANYNQKKIVDLLLNFKADINLCNYDKETPLHRACWCGYFDIVSALLTCGANVSAQTKSGNTPCILYIILISNVSL